ncbi:MAG: Ig-like domain-containing protein [Candidatus Eisenbacteria bacterium]
MMSSGSSRMAVEVLTAGLATALVFAAGLVAGCARVGPPTGGPTDSTPPEVTATVPESGATGVGRDIEIRLAFSEEMTRVAVERGFSIEPGIDLKNLRWDGHTLVARPASELPDSTTFTVRIADSVADYHGVAMGTPFVLMFSTGGSLDTGVISGAVSMLGEGVAGATVWACRRAVTTDGGAIRGCRYAALTDTDGRFRISGVAASERPYVLLAFIDGDEDGVYSVREETGRIADAAALIDGADAVAAGIQIELADGLEGDSPEGAWEEE